MSGQNNPPISANEYAETLIKYFEEGIRDNEFRECRYSYDEYVKSCCFFVSCKNKGGMDIKLGVRIFEILAFMRDTCNE